MPDPQRDRLDSWKEIAAYLKRSVRTVRRWEHSEGLPIHRHLHQSLGSVYAMKSEVDAWQRRSTRGAQAPQAVASIAVLPFTNLSTDRDNEYFAEGLAEEVTTKLSKIRMLRVTSRTSSNAFRGSTKSSKAIAAQLGVTYLLEGSVRRDERRVRIAAQLIDAARDAHVWAETYDGDADDIFAMQERLARVIAAALEVRLSADEERQLAERPIDNIAAYDLYLRARHEAWRWRKDAIDEAVRLLREGLAIIGDNARLYAALGFAYLQYREAGIDFSERPIIEAERCAQRVSSAPGSLLRGWINYSRGKIQDAIRDLEAALDLEPNNADALLLLSNCYLISGRVPEARPLIARALAIDPLTPITQCMPAYADLLEGNFAAAVEPYRQMFDMDQANPMARLFYIWVLLLNGREDEAKLIHSGFAENASIPSRIASFLTGSPIVMTPDIEAVATATDVFPRFLAQAYARAGDRKNALRWLNAAVDRGFINYRFLAVHDPFFQKLRGDREFKNLLAELAQRSAS